MSREQKTAKSAANIGEKQECRACLCKLGSKDVCYLIFDTWTPPMHGTQATIAEDLAKAANIQLSPMDEHSKIICKYCCDKLQEVCRFTSMVQDNDKILRLRHSKQKSEATMWPKPISIDKNIFDNSDVKIKEEDLSDDEYSAAMEVGKGFAAVDIKVEPEEILPDKIEITVNGTISLNEYKSENPVTNGDDCEVYEREEYLEEVKEEPASDSDSDACADLPLDCMLCSKPFKTISGLKAHVIAMHSYKSVRRRADSGASPERPAPASHVCATCRRSFTTPTDLMVHETCHAKACSGCCARFGTEHELAAHAASCRPHPTTTSATTGQRHKTAADTIRPPPAPSAGESCSQCGERFTDGYYLRIHREVHHAAPAQPQPAAGACASRMDAAALEDIFTGND